MIIRKSSQGYRIRIHRNTTPGVKRTKTYPDGTQEVLTYPSSYAYFVEVDGEVVKRSDSFKTIEEYYVSECAKKYAVATSQSDYPTDSNTKAEIKDFYDKRSISYSSSETKAELLSRIIPVVKGDKEISKHISR
jgi:hypothetical protein